MDAALPSTPSTLQKYNDSAILFENDNNASGQGSSQYDNYKLFFDGETQAPPVQDQRIHSFSPLSLSEDTDPELPWEKTTCRSKKVIMLVPSGYEDVTAHYQCEAYFKKHGWKDEDITIKANMENSSMDMRPEDFFHLDEYGIILIFAHGMIDDHSDEKKMWLECCTLDNETIRENELYRQWFDQKILIPKTGFRPVSKNETDTVNKTNVHWYYRIIIRLDILRQNIGSLPDSFVHLATCNGIYFKDAFMTNGAKIVLSWNRAVYRFVADTNQIHIVKCMLEKNYSVYASYHDNTVIRSYIDYWTTKHLLIEFLLYPLPNESSIAESFYFPAWLQLTVTSIPSGTSYITSSLYDSSSTLIGEAQDTVNPSDIQIECEHLKNLMAPSTEEVTVKIKAYNSGGQEFASGEKTVTLVAGGNPIQIALAESGGLTIEFTNQKNGQLDVHRSLNELWSLDLKAKLQNPPNGDILYVWDNLGDSSLGGFNMNKEQHLETDDYDTSFYSSGNGTDGQKDTYHMHCIPGERRWWKRVVSFRFR